MHRRRSSSRCWRRHLASLRANGAPPGIDPPSYYSRIGSLQLFAEAASDEAAAGSPQAAGRYAVIRQETGVLLSLVNGALRTAYALPAAADADHRDAGAVDRPGATPASR